MKRTRIAAAAAAVAVVGALAPIEASPTSAAQPAGRPATFAAGSSAVADAATTSVTLITGDVVSVNGADTANPTYVVTPADGADREGVTFGITRTPTATYIIPSDVADLVGSDLVLDQELFNVTRLVAERLDDASRSSLPLIVQTSDGQPFTSVPGLSSGRELKVLGAREASLNKSSAYSLGRHLAQGHVRVADATDVKRAKAKGAVAPRVELTNAGRGVDGISRIWLDGEVRAADWDANLTQVGAPTAWSGGATGAGVKVAVLDTGIDLTHPDLVGKVVNTANFSGTTSIADKVGHGTHVAGTIAGTGAAAAGARRGVAPDAELLIGKVLGDDGRGDLSNSVLGMQWAVDNGAKVVNMSLGSVPTDGTDPVSMALDQLSNSSGTLFVVAAGNTGPAASTVTSPSTAEQALAVAAVDGTGAVATFSSRGPRVGDNGLKPEIAAPGVAITAPRSSLMSGAPGQLYTTMSGTSMATPHVAGVAALLAQQHADWTGQRIKAALMTTTKPATGGVFAVGSGQVFTPAALASTIVPEEGSVTANLTEADNVVTKVVTVTNTTGQPVSATVAATTSAPSGAAVVSASPSNLTLEPGQSAPVSVTIDGSALPGAGFGNGQVSVTPSTGSPIVLPVVATRTRWLTIHATRVSGQAAPGAFLAVLNQADGRYLTAQTNADGDVRVPMSPGALSVTGTIQEQSAEGPVSSVVSVDVAAGQNNVTVDARAAVPIGAQVGQTTREEMALYGLIRLNNNAHTYISNQIIAGGAYGPIQRGQLRITPTAPNTPEASVWLTEHWILANKASANQVGDATKVYDLVFSRENVPPTPIHDLGTADVKKLAKMETDFAAPGQPFRSQFATTAIGPSITGLNVATPSYIAAPVKQTRYFTAGDVLWRLIPYRGKVVPGGSISMNLGLESRRFSEGEETSNSFWAGPLGGDGAATLTPTATGAALTGSFDDFVDSAGHTGSYAEFVFPSRGVTTTEIYRDGVLVGNRLSSPLAVAPEAARYRLVRSYLSQDVFPIGGNTRTVWETEPVAAGTTAVTLPLAQLRWVGHGLDLSNRATAGADTALEVHAASAALDASNRTIADTTAEWTTDGGLTWRPATVRQQGDQGTYRFTIPGGALHAGEWVGVRFRAVDAAGNSIAQTLLRAFPVA